MFQTRLQYTPSHYTSWSLQPTACTTSAWSRIKTEHLQCSSWNRTRPTTTDSIATNWCPNSPITVQRLSLEWKFWEIPERLVFSFQIVLVSVINDVKVFDTYALIDPGSTGTYVLDQITKALNMETSGTFDLDVQFLSISRTISVSSTHFLLAPYADLKFASPPLFIAARGGGACHWRDSSATEIL